MTAPDLRAALAAYEATIDGDDPNDFWSARDRLAEAAAAHVPGLLDERERLLAENAALRESRARALDEALTWARLYGLALDGPGAGDQPWMAELVGAHRDALDALPRRARWTRG